MKIFERIKFYLNGGDIFEDGESVVPANNSGGEKISGLQNDPPIKRTPKVLKRRKFILKK